MAERFRETPGGKLLGHDNRPEIAASIGDALRGRAQVRLAARSEAEQRAALDSLAQPLAAGEEEAQAIAAGVVALLGDTA